MERAEPEAEAEVEQRKEKGESPGAPLQELLEKEEAFGGPKFSPPLYKQRYARVAEILREHSVKRVVDFGCAECHVLPYYKAVLSLEEIVGVDLDAGVLERYRYMARPLNADYLQKRPVPLRERLFSGSVTEYDSRLEGFDAVTMIELIEHLHPDPLSSFPVNVFHRICPKIVVITTPNAEFNVLFPNFPGFRHWDHKFEWTRKQFQDWCNTQADLYGYSVEYYGLGKGPEGSEHLGCCSQMAVFLNTRQDSDIHKKPEQSQTPYCLIEESIHPHKIQTLSLEEEIQQEAEYYINFTVRGLTEQDQENLEGVVCYDESMVHISLEKLLSFPRLKTLCKDIGTLRKVLVGCQYKLTEDLSNVVYHIEEERDDEGLECEPWDDTEEPDFCSPLELSSDTVNVRASQTSLPSQWESGGQFSDAEDDWS